MAEKIFKVNCSWCKKEIECPENMLGADKHICFDCFSKHENELKDLNLGKLHIDFPRKEFEKRLPEIMAQALVEEAFPKIWGENRLQFGQLSKKELSRHMFAAGVMAMAETFREMSGQADAEEDAT